MSLHDPQRFADIVAAMIDIQKHEGTFCHCMAQSLSLNLHVYLSTGWLPEAREAGTKMFVQGGSSESP